MSGVPRLTCDPPPLPPSPFQQINLNIMVRLSASTTIQHHPEPTPPPPIVSWRPPSCVEYLSRPALSHPHCLRSFSYKTFLRKFVGSSPFPPLKLHRKFQEVVLPTRFPLFPTSSSPGAPWLPFGGNMSAHQLFSQPICVHTVAYDGLGKGL